MRQKYLNYERVGALNKITAMATHGKLRQGQMHHHLQLSHCPSQLHLVIIGRTPLMMMLFEFSDKHCYILICHLCHRFAKIEWLLCLQIYILIWVHTMLHKCFKITLTCMPLIFKF